MRISHLHIKNWKWQDFHKAATEEHFCLQELLPNVIKILQRGHHYGPALRIIECYLLLGQLESLSEYMPAILAVLEGSIQRVLDYKDTPQGPQFGRIGGTTPFLSGVVDLHKNMLCFD